jgi:hypothetical protein
MGSDDFEYGSLDYFRIKNQELQDQLTKWEPLGRLANKIAWLHHDGEEWMRLNDKLEAKCKMLQAQLNEFKAAKKKQPRRGTAGKSSA